MSIICFAREGESTYSFYCSYIGTYQFKKLKKKVLYLIPLILLQDLYSISAFCLPCSARSVSTWFRFAKHEIASFASHVYARRAQTRPYFPCSQLKRSSGFNSRVLCLGLEPRRMIDFVTNAFASISFFRVAAATVGLFKGKRTGDWIEQQKREMRSPFIRFIVPRPSVG